MGFDAWADGKCFESYLAECAASPKYARGRWLVLAAGDQLLSSLIVYNLDACAAGLGSIATAPERRRHGHASRLVALAVDAIEAVGKTRIFLFADIAPEFYEKLGFVALPQRFQRKPGSRCMVRAGDLDALLADPAFDPPEYF